MTWHQTWKNILVEGGSKRWKVDDRNIKKLALTTIQKYAQQTPAKSSKLSILCPLAGDDQFVHEAWQQGHSVTSIDLVPEAVDAMRKQFGTDGPGDDTDTWTKETQQPSNTVVWKHSSGRATLYVGDMLQDRSELSKKFDAVYDKDSFGALDKDMRSKYCERLAQFLKDDGIVYTEVKYKSDPAARESGPPCHVEKEDLMEPSSFGTSFEYVEGLGDIYDLGMPGMSQTGHILRRIPRSSSSS
jgi:Thiopurine S-methyltransferase (TPMT)